MKLCVENFKKPDPSCAVVYTWSWNDTVTREGIERALADFVRAGVEAVYILPLPREFRPTLNRTFMEPDYLSAEFFELVAYAVRRAKALGIGMWLYDEGGWPSGGACTHTLRQNPDAAVRRLLTREVALAAGERYIPSEHAVALFDGRRRLPCDFAAESDTVLTEYTAPPYVKHPNVVDLTRREATDTFIENTYEPYFRAVGEEFGTQLPIFFTDEPAADRRSLPCGFAEDFLAEYGYDIRDFLYVITGGSDACVTEEDNRARIDYGRLLGRKLRENTFLPLRDYCRAHGILYGGHLNNDNLAYGGMWCGCFGLVDCLRAFDVPGVDVIWEQIRYPYGGRSPLDEETRPFGFFPRLASSAARQEGRRQTLSESFAIYGAALSPEEIRFVVNYQIMRGINTFNFMSVSDSTRRGLALAFGSRFHPSMPGFDHLCGLHAYVARLCYLARLGHAEGDTALLHPAADFWADSETVAAASASFGALGTELEQKNIPFDILDEYGVRDAAVTEEGLRLGDACYRHIVLPRCRYLPHDVKEKIAPFLGVGEPIYTPKAEGIRVMTRGLENGRLWFFFNEQIEPVCEPLCLGGRRHLYRMELTSGHMYEDESPTLRLACGEIAVYFETDDVYETVRDEVAARVELDGFSAVSHDRFCVTAEGVCAVHAEGVPTADAPFSGCIHYEADYALPFAPRAGERYRLSLPDTSLSAAVEIGGVRLCDMALRPLSAEIDGAALPPCGRLRVSVSNTAADEIVAKREQLLSWLPPAEIGPYSVHYAFEERRPPLCFGGRVVIERLG